MACDRIFQSKTVAKRQMLAPVGDLGEWNSKSPEVAHLIISTETFIVFLDHEWDVDWETSTDYVERDDGREFNLILNRVAALETTPCEEIPFRMRRHFKRLLGEGVARALDHNYKSAESILDTAAAYILARNQETSRFWYLSSSSIVAAIFILIGIGFWFNRSYLQANIGVDAFWFAMCAIAGSTGALFSVISRTGQQYFDTSAGRRLHYLEASSRIWAGAISGVLVGIAIHSQLFLTALTRNGNMQSIMLLGALASGASERLATSIIADLEKPIRGKNGRTDDETQSTDNR